MKFQDMNKIVLTSIAFGLIALFGCSRMAPEVVEFDPSYKPKDPTKLDRSKVDAPPLDLLTKYVLFVDNDQEVLASFTAEEDGTKQAEDIDDAQVVVRLSSKRDKDLTVKITEMTEQNQPATYKTVVIGENKVLPADTYTLSAREVTFVAGDVEQVLTVSFDKEKIKELDKHYNYVLPLVVEIPQEPELKDHNFCLLTVKLNEIEVIPAGQNVKYSYTGVDGLSLMPYSSISVQTTYRQDRVGVVLDGQTSANWWVPSNSSETLTLTFPKQRVKGLKIHTTSTKDIKTIDLAISNTGGNKFVPQGTVTNPNPGDWMMGTPTIIVFDKAYEIDAIKFSNFVGNRDYIDVTEIELYY